MRNYLIRRIGQSIVMSFFVSALIFFILQIVPGGPFDLLPLSNPKITRSHIERLNKLLGLDKPIPVRYVEWLLGNDWVKDDQGNYGTGKGILRGDWGDSWTFSAGTPVTQLILSRLGYTLLLTITSTLLAVGVALPIGIYSAIRQYSFSDYLVTAFTFFGRSMPTFWLGIMAVIIFSLSLQWFPTSGVSTPQMGGDIMDVICNVVTLGNNLPILKCSPVPPDRWQDITLDGLKHLAMPAIVLAIFSMAGWSRYMRSSMLEVLRQDYMRTARAKGVRERAVVLKHGLRNALIPIVTILGLDIPSLVSGAIITETIFAWPGMGRLFFDGLGQVDWPLVQGILVMIAVLVIFSNLIADLLYAIVDPRIQYS